MQICMLTKCKELCIESQGRNGFKPTKQRHLTSSELLVKILFLGGPPEFTVPCPLSVVCWSVLRETDTEK